MGNRELIVLRGKRGAAIVNRRDPIRVLVGEQGVRGPQGNTGPAGATGAPGADGTSIMSRVPVIAMYSLWPSGEISMPLAPEALRPAMCWNPICPGCHTSNSPVGLPSSICWNV